MSERFCTDQKRLKIFKISFHKNTIAAKENQKADSEQQQKYILKILSIAQQSQWIDFSEQITIKSILPLPAIILFAQTSRNHFPKKWQFDELYHSTASGDKYYWHLSWRSWHCSPNIYQTGCSRYCFVCQKKDKLNLPDQHKKN